MTKDAKPAEKVPAVAELAAEIAALKALMRANGWSVHD